MTVRKELWKQAVGEGMAPKPNAGMTLQMCTRQSDHPISEQKGVLQYYIKAKGINLADPDMQHNCVRGSGQHHDGDTLAALGAHSPTGEKRFYIRKTEQTEREGGSKSQSLKARCRM